MLLANHLRDSKQGRQRTYRRMFAWLSSPSHLRATAAPQPGPGSSVGSSRLVFQHSLTFCAIQPAMSAAWFWFRGLKKENRLCGDEAASNTFIRLSLFCWVEWTRNDWWPGLYRRSLPQVWSTLTRSDISAEHPGDTQNLSRSYSSPALPGSVHSKPKGGCLWILFTFLCLFDLPTGSFVVLPCLLLLANPMSTLWGYSFVSSLLVTSPLRPQIPIFGWKPSSTWVFHILC